MIKRIIALLLMLAAFAAAALPASAAGDEMTLQIGSVSTGLTPGEEIRVPVTATVNPGYVSATLTLRWDSDALELCAVEFSELAPDQGTPEPRNSGAYTLRVGQSARRENFSGTGTFFTAVFRTAAAATAGEYAVDLTNAVVLDTDLHYVEVNVIPGTVSLNAAPVPASASAPTAAAPTAAEITPTSAPAPATTPDSAAAEDTEPLYRPTDAAPVPTSSPALAVAPTQADRSVPTAAADTPADEQEGGSTVPWLTIGAVAAALIAVVAVAVRRRKTK